MAENDGRITCPVCGKTHSSISGGYCPYCEKVTSDDPVVMPKKKPYDQIIEEQQEKVRPNVKHGKGSYGRPIVTSNVSREEHPIEHPKPTPKPEPEHVIIERDVVFNPNTCSILSFTFAWFFPILGYPFGIIGRERAKRTGDVTGRKLANAGYILSIIFYIAYCALGMVFAWLDWWSTGLIVTLVLIVFSFVYFPLCDRLKKDK